jgi:nitroreductase
MIAIFTPIRNRPMFIDLLRQRRSHRQFHPDPIPPEQVEELIEALLRSPSSRGLVPWHFVLVDDPQLLDRLSRAKAHGAGFLAGAPLAVVICADPARSDVWIEDCAIAAILLQLAAESLGLGSCWAQMRLRFDSAGRSAEANVREILHLPAEWSVDCIIAIGHPQSRLPGHPRSSLPVDRVHRNCFPEN